MAGSVWQGGQVVPYYHCQTAFTAGEISDEVASRIDLDKYQFALLQCKNALIRPYGPAYKRPGTKYKAEVKNSGEAILVPFTSGLGYDYVLEVGNKYLRVYKYGVYQAEIATPFETDILQDLRFTQSADTMYITSGWYPVKKLVHLSTSPESWALRDFEIVEDYFQETILDTDKTLTPSGTTGTITLTCGDGIFYPDMVGAKMQIKQTVASVTVKTDNGTSSALYIGEQWKILTGGTWTGTIKIERSVDGGSTWREYRSYSGTDNYNATETGTVTDGQYLRVSCSISSGTASVSLTALPYTKTGKVRITAVGAAGSRTATATVIETLGNTDPTYSYGISSWNNDYGYPKTCCFFQDRLWFGGTDKQPYALWYSRSGDYTNFSVEEVSGTVTDDSAGMLNLISRKQYKIKHLLAGKDLLIFTEGNEWIISGSSTITPSSVTTQMQSARGCNDCEPMMVGNRLVFVQKRGSNVRDMGYSYETDSYDGTDLTMLAEQVIENKELIDCAYKQEPDSLLLFVRNDGDIVCLSYMYEQKVYAWSILQTQGAFEAVCVAQEGDVDVTYVIVKRNIKGSSKRFLEAMTNVPKTNNPSDYIMLDSAVVPTIETATGTFTVSHLAGAKVDVLADGRCFKNLTVANDGTLTIPANVTHAVIGLQYVMKLELPNVEIKTGDGTMQGRWKTVTNTILRLKNTLGGEIGPDENTLDAISYEELQETENIPLYSGDKKILMPSGGFNQDGRVFIQSSDPYPFDIMMCVRQVSFGG